MSRKLYLLPVEREANELERKIWESRPLMLNLCRRMLYGQLNKEALAEDLVSEAIIKALKSQASFQAKSKVSVWMYQITHNVVNDFFRSKKLRPQHFGYIPIEVFLRFSDISDNHSEDRQISRIDGSRMWQLLEEQLSRERYEILVEKLTQDKTLQEIASQLGIPVGTVKSRYFQALGFLKTLGVRPEES